MPPSKRPPLSRRIAAGPHAELRDRLSAHVPYLAELDAPLVIPEAPGPEGSFSIATYNVHRWAGVTGGRTFAPERAFAVIDELDADVIALQEVLRPFEGDDPLALLAEKLGYALAFVCTRVHRRGELGNAVLARWPLAAGFAIDLSFGRLEQRAALAVQLRSAVGPITIAAAHLALVDRTRTRQVEALLTHPQIARGPVVLLGDMNAWRTSKAARDLDREFVTRHHNANWPASWPSVRPVLALDRAYGRGARLDGLRTHTSAATRKGSDHLPVVATVVLEDSER